MPVLFEQDAVRDSLRVDHAPERPW
jgi:hypothetical protein